MPTKLHKHLDNIIPINAHVTYIPYPPCQCHVYVPGGAGCLQLFPLLDASLHLCQRT